MQRAVVAIAAAAALLGGCAGGPDQPLQENRFPLAFYVPADHSDIAGFISTGVLKVVDGCVTVAIDDRNYLVVLPMNSTVTVELDSVSFFDGQETVRSGEPVLVTPPPGEEFEISDALLRRWPLDCEKLYRSGDYDVVFARSFGPMPPPID